MASEPEGYTCTVDDCSIPECGYLLNTLIEVPCSTALLRFRIDISQNVQHAGLHMFRAVNRTPSADAEVGQSGAAIVTCAVP